MGNSLSYDNKLRILNTKNGSIPMSKDTLNEEDYVKAMKCDGLQLKYISNQTENIAFAAVENNPKAFKYVKYPTKKILLKTLEKDISALKYVKNIIGDMTANIIHHTVCHNVCLNISDEYYITYASAKKYNLSEFLDGANYRNGRLYAESIITRNVCKYIFKKYVDVANNRDELCLELIKLNGNYLEFVKNPTKQICQIAIKQTPSAIKFVKMQI